jgi:hypothetical protein
MSNLYLPGTVTVETRDAASAPVSKLSFTLTEHAQEWHYFNHGVLFTHAGFTLQEDPVQDWYAQQPTGTQVICEPFGSTIVEGLTALAGIGRLTWGHVVCAVRHADWLSLQKFMLGMAVIDRTKKMFGTMTADNVPILDPVIVERDGLLGALAAPLPTVTITIFGLDSNKGNWAAVSGSHRSASAEMRSLPVRPETIQLAEAVLAGDMSPLASREPEHATSLNQETIRQLRHYAGGDS